MSIAGFKKWGYSVFATKGRRHSLAQLRRGRINKGKRRK